MTAWQIIERKLYNKVFNIVIAFLESATEIKPSYKRQPQSLKRLPRLDIFDGPLREVELYIKFVPGLMSLNGWTIDNVRNLLPSPTLDRKVVVKIQHNWILYVYLSTCSQNEYMRDVCLSLKSTKRHLAISQDLFNLLQPSVTHLLPQSSTVHPIFLINNVFFLVFLFRWADSSHFTRIQQERQTTRA